MQSHQTHIVRRKRHSVEVQNWSQLTYGDRTWNCGYLGKVMTGKWRKGGFYDANNSLFLHLNGGYLGVETL